MLYERDAAGNISAVYRQPQEGKALEELPDDHPDVVAYWNPPNAAIKAQLERIDRLAGGGRGLREFIIVQAQVTDALIARGLLPGAAPIGDNIGIVKVRQLELEAAVLRAQLVPE